MDNVIAIGCLAVFGVLLILQVFTRGMVRMVRRFSGAATPVWIAEFADRLGHMS